MELSAFSIVQNSKEHKKTKSFGNWIHLCPQVRERETTTLLGPLERDNPHDWK
jgi:hypothetical protein